MFDIDSESERTLTEEPKEPTEHKEPQNPKFDLNRSETPQGITKRKLAPTVLPFESSTNKDRKLKTETKVIVRLKKLDISTKRDVEKRLLVNPKKLEESLEKGLEKRIEVIEKVIHNPEKGPEKWAEATGKPHIKPRKATSYHTTLINPIKSFIISISRTSSNGDMEEIKNALIESNRVAAMPIPQFYGKKGEKSEDHIMKVEDYFQNYNIRDQEQKRNRIRDTCCGKASTWLSTLTEYPKIFDPEEAPDEAAKAKTMKSMFLASWQLKGRTPQMLYMCNRSKLVIYY